MTDTPATPESYTDSIAPAPEWGDDTATAEQFIRHNLAQAGRFDALSDIAWKEAYGGGSTRSGNRSVKDFAHYIVCFLYKAVQADLMMTIAEIAPDRADDISRNITARLEAGDYYPENVWEWLQERDIDPHKIQDEINAAHTAETS